MKIILDLFQEASVYLLDQGKMRFIQFNGSIKSHENCCL